MANSTKENPYKGKGKAAKFTGKTEFPASYYWPPKEDKKTTKGTSKKKK